MQTDVTEITRIFNRFDTDGSGTIEPGEFLPLLAMLTGVPKSQIDKGELWKHWNAVDADGNGHLSFDEFRAWYCQLFEVREFPDYSDCFHAESLLSAEQLNARQVAKKVGVDAMQVDKLYEEFKRVDTDGSGEIEFDEFEVMMKSYLKSSDVPPKVLQKFWCELDADSSGGASFEEFVIWHTRCFSQDGGFPCPMENFYHTLGVGMRHEAQAQGGC